MAFGVSHLVLEPRQAYGANMPPYSPGIYCIDYRRWDGCRRFRGRKLIQIRLATEKEELGFSSRLVGVFFLLGSG